MTTGNSAANSNVYVCFDIIRRSIYWRTNGPPREHSVFLPSFKITVRTPNTLILANPSELVAWPDQASNHVALTTIPIQGWWLTFAHV